MSQTLSQTQDLMTLPLEKFSTNSCRYGVRRFTWNHFEGNNLVFVLQSIVSIGRYGDSTARAMMRITQGEDILEIQDLREVLQDLLGFVPSSSTMQVEVPVQIIVKCPFLALRYPKAANNVQRVQLKFRNSTDFSKVSLFLRDFGFPLTVSEPPRRPNSTSTIQPSPSPALSLLSDGNTSISSATTCNSNLLPLSTQSLVSKARLNASNQSDSMLNYESYAKFQRPLLPVISLEQRRSTSILDSQIPDHSSGQHRNLNVLTSQKPVLHTFFNPEMASALARIGSSFGNTENAQRYDSQAERDARKYSHRELSAQDVSDTSARQNNSLVISQTNSNRHQYPLSDRPHNPETTTSTSPFFQPRSNAVNLEERAQVIHDDARHRLQVTNSGQSLPSFEPDHFESLSMPAKRDLPLSRPQTIARPTSSSSLVGLSSLPKPTPVMRPTSAAAAATTAGAFTPSTKTTIRRVAQRKATTTEVVEENSSLNEPLPHYMVKEVSVGDRTARGDELSPLAVKSAAASRPMLAAPGLQSKAATIKKRTPPISTLPIAKVPKTCKMLDQSTQTQTLSGRDHTSAIGVARRSQSDEELSSGVDATTQTHVLPPTPPVENYLNLVDEYMTTHASRPIPQIELWEEPGWTEGDEEQRKIILNTFLCDCIEDEKFLQLCKDIDNSWRKMNFEGLGTWR